MRLFLFAGNVHSILTAQKRKLQKGKEDEVLCIKLTIFTWDYFLWRGKMQ